MTYLFSAPQKDFLTWSPYNGRFFRVQVGFSFLYAVSRVRSRYGRIGAKGPILDTDPQNQDAQPFGFRV